MTANTPTATLCPSAQHEAPDARVFAVVAGTPDQPDTAYLDEALPMSDALIEMAAPVSPAEVFRIAAPCIQSTECWHFDEAQRTCRLATRTVRLAPVVVSKPPRCAIRSQCQWWHQDGVSACLRCPQVITNDVSPNALALRAGDPRNLSDAR